MQNIIENFLFLSQILWHICDATNFNKYRQNRCKFAKNVIYKTISYMPNYANIFLVKLFFNKIFGGFMENEKTKVLIVDDAETAKKLKSALEEEKFEVVGEVETVSEAYDIITEKTPDVVITEIVLKGQDGFELLEKANMLKSAPKFFVLSALTQQTAIEKATELGAIYYMAKPFDQKVFYKRFCEVVFAKTSVNHSSIKSKELEEKITNVFITVGIPAHIKGYQFLREAIKMAIAEPEIINSITKRLYPSIANKFETSSSKVERAIRHAIEVAWNRGKIENINSLFGVKVYGENEKPTNGEFIALVADKMLLEGI